MESDIVNSYGENIVSITLKLFYVFFLKIVKIEFKMKLHSFFCLEFFQVPTKHDFSYLAPHLSKWNESKLPTFIKFYTMRYNLFLFLKKYYLMLSLLP